VREAAPEGELADGDVSAAGGRDIAEGVPPPPPALARALGDPAIGGKTDPDEVALGDEGAARGVFEAPATAGKDTDEDGDGDGATAAADTGTREGIPFKEAAEDGVDGMDGEDDKTTLVLGGVGDTGTMG
jgi:hypothetical protein